MDTAIKHWIFVRHQIKVGTTDGRRMNLMLLRRLLFHAARKAAADPRVRAKAADVFEREIMPRATAAWSETKPRLDAARDDIKKAAATVDPRSDPAGFAGELKRRIAQKRPRERDR